MRSARSTEVSGFFRLVAWLSIDQRDTDFNVNIYEITGDGNSIFLANDLMRARYRNNVRVETLIESEKPLEYRFEHFTFVSRRISAGTRLSLTLGPNNSIYSQKIYNSGAQTMRDARTVSVTLLHDAKHPSVLYVPIG